MSLPRDLLEQAKHLANKEPKRPKQASLRRSVSAAYYALFHLLTDAAARLLISGAGSEREALRMAIRRAFGHGEMKRVSALFRRPTVPTEWQEALGSPQVPARLREVADAFVELQDARHDADYDLSKRYTRKEAYELVRRCETAFEAWTQTKGTQAADTYLTALLVHTRRRG